MGQYYFICNIDKQELLYPHLFGDGLKLMEFGCSAKGTLTALAVLLADGNGRGGGDLESNNPIIGSWAGDRIVVSGDYADEGRFLDKEHSKTNLHTYAREHYTDISLDILLALFDEKYLREVFEKEPSFGNDKDIKDALLIYKTTPKDYPLLIGSLQSERGKAYLERAIKQEATKPAKAAKAPEKKKPTPKPQKTKRTLEDRVARLAHSIRKGEVA